MIPWLKSCYHILPQILYLKKFHQNSPSKGQINKTTYRHNKCINNQTTTDILNQWIKMSLPHPDQLLKLQFCCPTAHNHRRMIPILSCEDHILHNNQANTTPTKFNKSPINIDRPTIHASQESGISGTECDCVAFNHQQIFHVT